MQSIEYVPPAPEPGVPAETPKSWSRSARKSSPLEQFDAVMGRTLARAHPAASEDSDPSGELPEVKNRPPRAHEPDSNPSAQMACADNAPPPVSPPAASTPGGPQIHAETELPSETSSSSGPVAGIAGAASTGGAVTTASVPNGDSAGTVASLPGQLSASPKDSAAPSAAGFKIDLEKELGAADQAIPNPERLLSTPAAAARATPETGSYGADPGVEAGKSGRRGLRATGNAEAAGISVAQQDAGMLKAEKTNELSAVAEKNLPAPPAGVTGEQLPAALMRPEKREPVSAPDAALSGISAPAETVSAASNSSHWPAETPLRSLERAQDLMSLHAFRLRDSGADSLQVVIKPGPGLQLSLSLQMRDGAVEMQATLHRGDFDFMNRHWAELQQQLEARGVRLASLVSSEQHSGGTQNPFQEQGRRPEDGDAVQSGAFAEFALTNALKPAAAAKTTKTLRGWESWA